MKKVFRTFLIIIIMIFIFLLYSQKVNILEESTIEKNIDKVIEISIIDKYKNMEKIYKHPELEEYYEVDLIIDGIYYYNVGIRAKGTSIYNWLDLHDSNKLSFKVRLDYINLNQNYNGMTEIHLNSHVMDASGMREYLVYEIYNEVGIDTQKYCLAELKIDNKSIGLVTLVEVINEAYVEEIYDNQNGNLYKPLNQMYKNVYGADLLYRGDNLKKYTGIFENVKTKNTSLEDQERLVSILKKINEAKTIEEIEGCFIDFDKILKMLAVNKVVSNIDGVTGKSLRNYYLYEENGKIDILAFDFNLSLGIRPTEYYFTEEDVNDIGLIELTYVNHSYLVDIINNNPVLMERYNEYIKAVQKIMDNMELDKRIDEIDAKIRNIVKNDTEKYYTYEEYNKDIIKLKNFIQERIEKRSDEDG